MIQGKRNDQAKRADFVNIKRSNAKLQIEKILWSNAFFFGKRMCNYK